MLFEKDKLKGGAMTIRALRHDLRQSIINLIEKNPRMNVTDLYKTLAIEQSVASQHLAILRRAKIVRAERKGKQILYSVDKDRIEFITLKCQELQ